MIDQGWAKPSEAEGWCFLVFFIFYFLSFRLSLCLCLCVYMRVCVFSRLAFAPPPRNPVKHLDNRGTAGSAFLHTAAWKKPWCEHQHFNEELNTAKDGQIWVSIDLYFLSVLSFPLPQSASSALLAPVVNPFSWLNTGTDVAERLKGSLCAISPAAGPGSSRERLL